MLTVRDSIHVAAPPETVFDYLDAPARQPDFTPHLTRSQLIERLDNGGARVAYTYEMAGLAFSGEVRATDYTPPDRIVWAMSGDLTGSLRWYFDAEGAGTRFTYAATYEVPGPSLFRPLATPVVQWVNEREVRRLLAAVKSQIEAHAPVR